MTNLVEFPAGGAPLQLRVAEEVRVLMTRHRVKQSDLAAVLNVRQPAVSQRLNGHVDFTVSELETLARFFRVAPAVLLGHTVNPHGPNGDGGASLPRLDSNQQPFGNRFMQVNRAMADATAA